jgi:D-alanine-D-alanine ligase
MMRWRDQVRETDRQAVRRLVLSTSFFSAEELEIAVELVDEALSCGSASGYEFIFADAGNPGGDLLGYVCFGPIPSRPGAFDLYWIAVSPKCQRHGLGKELIREAERRAALAGATEMYIDTSGRSQYQPTRSFYERAGYTTHEVQPAFYAPGDDKVVYRKQIGVGSLQVIDVSGNKS